MNGNTYWERDRNTRLLAAAAFFKVRLMENSLGIDFHKQNMHNKQRYWNTIE